MNLLADMGAQPATLQSDLTAASASTDTTAPTSTHHASPSTVSDGSQVTISGTASDTGGGVVAGVEVSTDGGATWHPATGTTSWTYTWTAHGNPSTDGQGARRRRQRQPADARRRRHGQRHLPLLAVGHEHRGARRRRRLRRPDAGRGRRQVQGRQLRRRHRRALLQGRGQHRHAHRHRCGAPTGRAWPRRPSPARRAPGWQTVTFATPVQVTPGHHLRRLLLRAQRPLRGHGRLPLPQSRARAQRRRHGRRAAPARRCATPARTTNGVYTYSASSTFPVNSFGAANYWVDVVFSPTPAPGQVTNVSAVAGGKTSANVTWSAPATGGAVTSYKITPYVGSTAQTPDHDQRLAARDGRDDHRADHGHDLHVHGAGDQPDRLGAGVRAVQLRDPADRGGARRCRPGSPRRRPRARRR